ncbi:MAG TPA: hypothetical protein DIS98_15465 [Colwellia sp.]|nr:hypothetical protein [Colwellia sp.]|tara:strand:- start:150 stop:1205 length:1056 start_codon:yes stop_codon:yes gene_type:complete
MKISFKTEKQINPTKNDGFKVAYAPAKRIAFKIRWYLLLSLILSPLVIFGWYMIKQKVLITAVGILTTEPIVLVSAEEGFIRSIDVVPGERVQSKQKLLQMYSPILMKDQELLSRNYELFSTYHKQGLDSIEVLYMRQIATYKKAALSQRLISKEYQEYNERGVLPLSDKLLIQRSNVEATGRYQEVLISYETAVEEHKKGDLAKSLLHIERALIQVKVKQQMLSVFTPKAAIVNNIMVKEGQFVDKSEPLISISNLAKPVVHVYLAPERMDYVKMGQTAIITLPNGKTYDGVVNTPTQLSEQLPGVLSGPFKGSESAIKVTLDITPIPEVIIEGLPVKIRFHYTAEKSLF